MVHGMIEKLINTVLGGLNPDIGSRDAPNRGTAMNQTSKIEIPVKEATAVALADLRRREAVGHLVDRLVQPEVDDPLVALFERISGEARDAGLTGAEIETELAIYNAERRG
jgi:hypothetical protein